MDEVALNTQANRYIKARQVNATNTSFPSKIPTGTKPTTVDPASATGQMAHELVQTPGGKTYNGVKIIPYGTGDDNDVFAMRVIAWSYVDAPNSPAPDTRLWIPTILTELTCTMSTSVGVANKTIVAAERFCDTIALVGTSGNDDISIDIVSPADNTPAHIVVDLKGAMLLEITFDMTTGDPTDANALLKFL